MTDSNFCRHISDQRMKVPIGTGPGADAINDGGVCVVRQGQWTGSNRYGTIQSMSLEVRTFPALL
jgi:hypothetical protein